MKKIIIFLITLLLLAGCTKGKPATVNMINVEIGNGTTEVITKVTMNYSLSDKELGSKSINSDLKETEYTSFKLYEEDFSSKELKDLKINIHVDVNERDIELGTITIHKPEYNETYSFTIVGKLSDGLLLTQSSNIQVTGGGTTSNTGSEKEPEKPNNTSSGNNTSNEKEVEFPYDDFIGYWNSLTNDEYIHIFKGNGGYEWEIMYWNALEYAQGNPDTFKPQSCTQGEFDSYIVTLKNSKDTRTLQIDPSAVQYGQMMANGTVYEFVGQEVNQAHMAYDFRMVRNTMSSINGYWNNTKDNKFAGFTMDENGEYRYTQGLWMSDYMESGYVTGMETTQTGNKSVSVWFPAVNATEFSSGRDAYSFDFEIDLSRLSENILIIAGEEYRYAGYDMNTAYSDFEKNFPW